MAPTSGGIVMLKEMVEKLPPSEKKIAEFILKNPQKAIGLTAQELAKESSTSSAAVIRLCKSLGLKGFGHLKLRIAGDIQPSEQVGYRDIKAGESSSIIIEKITNNSIQTIRETAQLLQQEHLDKAAKVITEADTIHFFGVGASYIIALDAQQKFLRINKQATAFSDLHMTSMVVANAKPKDVFIGISFSGETAEVINLVNFAKSRDIQTVGITRYGSSSLSDNADFVLTTSPSKEAVFRSGAMSSRLAQLHVIDILFMCVATQQYEQSVKYLDQSRTGIEFIKNSKG